jgi:hypothetical protein
MSWMRSAGAVLVAGSLSLLGCGPTLEEGDLKDTGRYAACELRAFTSAACGDVESFNLEKCEPSTLGGLPRDGIFTAVYRKDGEPLFFDVDSFRLSGDGSLDAYRGEAPTQRQVDAEHFFLSSTRQLSSSLTSRSSLVGCRAEGKRLYGCYVSCRNGRVTSSGTFLAERWARRAGETEGSGLRLASESLVTQGTPLDVYVTQGHAYVVSGPLGVEGGGLSVFDVRDTSAPVLKKTLSLEGDNDWNGVWAKGNALYVASNRSGVLVFDITNPADPRLVRGSPAGGINVHTVFVEGERLYAMSPSPQPKTLIFDIREPTEPVLLGQYVEWGAGSDWRVGYPHDALAFEDRLYINHWSAGYLLVDVSDPANPRKLGAYTYAQATSHANAVGRFGERLIAFEGGETWGGHLRVLDVTDPGQPEKLGEYKLEPNASIHNMVLKGERLYIAYYHHGVRVLDVSRPENPREVAYYNTFRETDPDRGLSFFEGAIGMRVPGDGYVYVIDTSRGLLIFPEPQ